jgi:cysteate synthase
MGDHILKCLYPSCGKEYPGERSMRFQCDEELQGQHGPALLRAVYSLKQIRVQQNLPGIFAFLDWLPTSRVLRFSDRELGKPFSYKSSGFASRLGLNNLYIAFSGYWPEKGPNVLSRSFKEFEAQASISRLFDVYSDRQIPPLIVASAGNTGNAYSLITTLLRMSLHLVVPESGLKNLALPIKAAAKVLAVSGDYSDAIQMAQNLGPHLDAQADGGVRNVARRAGMGTAYLNAVAHPEHGTQVLFDHYFQAVGSGSGAIATWKPLTIWFRMDDLARSGLEFTSRRTSLSRR